MVLELSGCKGVSWLHVLRGMEGRLKVWVSEGLPHRPLSSSFLGLPCRILNINHPKELLRGLWVVFKGVGFKV